MEKTSINWWIFQQAMFDFSQSCGDSYPEYHKSENRSSAGATWMSVDLFFPRHVVLWIINSVHPIVGKKTRNNHAQLRIAKYHAKSYRDL